MVDPSPHQPTRRERQAELQGLLSSKASDEIASDTRLAAICLGSADREFSCVFFDQAEATRSLGRDGITLITIADKNYFISSWAVYDPQQQERVLIELVHRLLFEPSVFNDPFNHASGRILGNVNLDRGEFTKSGEKGRPCISGMPSANEIIDVLREQGYFAETKDNSKLIQVIKTNLPSKS